MRGLERCRLFHMQKTHLWFVLSSFTLRCYVCLLCSSDVLGLIHPSIAFEDTLGSVRHQTLGNVGAQFSDLSGFNGTLSTK